jgi:hypothetical protein
MGVALDRCLSSLSVISRTLDGRDGRQTDVSKMAEATALIGAGPYKRSDTRTRSSDASVGVVTGCE